MVIERSMHPQYLSNTYLVGEPGSAGFFVDAGGPVTPLVAAAERHEMTPTHVLLTHHHHDHVEELGRLTERWPDLQVLAHPDERVDGVTDTMAPGQTVQVGDLEVRTLPTPGHTTYADLKHSIMDVLLALPPETVIRPGHTEPTTVADEWEHNAFVRVWRGLDPEGDAPCTAMGEPATLVLLGDDYDGGHKAWVRWPDGSDDIVAGSQVKQGRPADAR